MANKEPDYIEEFPISEERIRDRVCELGRHIIEDLQSQAGSDKAIELTVMPVLRGAFVFAADLIRHFHTPGGAHPHKLICPVEPVIASSYGNTRQSQQVHLDWRMVDERNIRNRHVLIVDDILDSGRTMATIREQIRSRSPASVKIAVLLDKACRRSPELNMAADYCAFRIPDVWVVGYGMDDGGLFRHFPYVDVTPKPHA